MSITPSQKPGYVIAQAIGPVGSGFTTNWSSAPVWISNINEVNFQMNWTSGLNAGTLSLVASNMDLPTISSISYVGPIPPPAGYVPSAPTPGATQPPPLTAVQIGSSLNLASTSSPAMFDAVTAAGWVWIEYTAAASSSASGTLSIAYSGKSYG